MTLPDTQRAIVAVWRLDAPKIIGTLARLVRDLALAEDLAHDALLAALQQWPSEGIPHNPAAWLPGVAKHRAIDQLRRRGRLVRKHDEIARDLQALPSGEAAALEARLDDDIGDEVLRLVFTACHPVLPLTSRVALTLRLLGGLTTDEIARAFLVPEPTIAQRIVRAKRTIAKARVPFDVPRGQDRDARLASVLDVIYLIFNEGYSATAGDDWVRPSLCDEALRLGRALAASMPDEPEVHGLVALMELQASRLRARVGAAGEAVRLLDQDRARWDRLLISRGLAALRRADALDGNRRPFALQAAIAAEHARATTAETIDWPAIERLYQQLVQATGSPVVRLNHAVAVAMAGGPERALAMVGALEASGALRDYHYLPAVHGDLLARLGRLADAALQFQRAAALTRNLRERDLLEARAAACRGQG